MSNREFPKHFCILPWVHMHVDTWGRAKACCIGQIEYGNVNKQNLNALWNSDSIRKTRKNMLNNTFNRRCKTCYENESIDGSSMRIDYLAKYNDLAENVFKNKSIESPTNSPIFWDIRFSNYCNFKCITCWHGASSAWYREAKKNNNTAGEQAVIKAFNNIDSFFDEIKNDIKQVEEVFMAGGEPLIMPENKRFINLLMENNANAKITINTNLSVLPTEEILKNWCENLNIHFQVSCDGISKVGEKIRRGLNFRKFIENFKLIQSILPAEKVTVHFTLSKYNISHLISTINYFRAEELSDENFKINLLTRPAHMKFTRFESDEKLKLELKSFKSNYSSLEHQIKKIAKQLDLSTNN